MPSFPPIGVRQIILSIGSWRIKFLKLMDHIGGFACAALLPSAKKNSILPDRDVRLLIIRPGGIGDAIFLIPFLQHLRQQKNIRSLHILCEKRNKEVFEYCKQHKNIYQINRSIGGADFEIEVIVKNLPHLLSLIDEMKQQFPEVIRDVDYFGFSTFHILKYIPD